ncbi:MAG: SixA phosphatase family protein [Actinomycetes bacterium]
MSLFLVRHAKAGKRSQWDTDDSLRPLVAEGVRQAEVIAESIAPLHPTALFSSPYVRCMQTLEPLSRATGLHVAPHDLLAEGVDFSRTVEWMHTLADGAVMCSHGDVIPEVIDALERRGMEVSGFRESRKGSVWILDRLDDQFTAGHAWPPPHLEKLSQQALS